MGPGPTAVRPWAGKGTSDARERTCAREVQAVEARTVLSKVLCCCASLSPSARSTSAAQAESGKPPTGNDHLMANAAHTHRPPSMLRYLRNNEASGGLVLKYRAAQALCHAVLRYNPEGMTGLHDRPRPGRR